MVVSNSSKNVFVLDAGAGHSRPGQEKPPVASSWDMTAASRPLSGQSTLAPGSQVIVLVPALGHLSRSRKTSFLPASQAGQPRGESRPRCAQRRRTASPQPQAENQVRCLLSATEMGQSGPRPSQATGQHRAATRCSSPTRPPRNSVSLQQSVSGKVCASGTGSSLPAHEANAARSQHPDEGPAPSRGPRRPAWTPPQFLAHPVTRTPDPAGRAGG